MISIPKLDCTIHGNSPTCISVGNVSILPIRVKFADTQLGSVTLVQLAMTTMWNKSEENATEKVIITNAMTDKELYNGDAKNGVGVKYFLDKCSDWD